MSSGGGDGVVNISVYNKAGEIFTKNYYDGVFTETYDLNTSGLYGKLKKGTYYVRVKKISTGNGYFTLKWI
jgi:hypothetical protein